METETYECNMVTLTFNPIHDNIPQFQNIFVCLNVM